MWSPSRSSTPRLVLVTGLLLFPGLLLAQQGALSPPERELFHQDVAWSPDGRWLAYSQIADGSDYQAEKWSIWVARSDGSEARRVMENARGVTWSPAGDRLAFASPRSGNWEVWSVALDGSDLRRLTNHPGKDDQPAWSPDGSSIAFSSDREGNREIHVMAVEGGEVRRLTGNPADDFNPSWSPDGRELVFFREKGDGRDQIHRVTLEGAELPVTEDENLNTFPSFLPDGRIAFSCKSPDGEERLVRVTRTGGERTEISPAGPFFGRWSPNGKAIVWIAGPWPRSAIYRMSAEGGAVKKIVN